MKEKTIAMLATILLSGVAHADKIKQVEIINENLTVSGEVTATLDGPVTVSGPIEIDQPVQVNGEITVGNTVGVDVLSLPANSAAITDIATVNAQLVSSDSTLDVAIGGIPENSRLLFADVEVLFTGSGHNCLARIEFQRSGGTFVALGYVSNQSLNRFQRNLQFGGLTLQSGDALRMHMVRATGGGNCVGNATIFYQPPS